MRQNTQKIRRWKQFKRMFRLQTIFLLLLTSTWARANAADNIVKYVKKVKFLMETYGKISPQASEGDLIYQAKYRHVCMYVCFF